jgi:hypothetical protein
MVLGGMLVAAACLGLERYAGVRFTKEPLALITLVGMPLGGIIGGLLGWWSMSYSDQHRGPDEPSQ